MTRPRVQTEPVKTADSRTGQMHIQGSEFWPASAYLPPPDNMPIQEWVGWGGSVTTLKQGPTPGAGGSGGSGGGGRYGLVVGGAVLASVPDLT